MTEDGSPPPNEQRDVRRHDPARRWTIGLALLAAILLAWSLVADRFTPYTSQARVRTFVVPVAADVSGFVTQVAITDNQLVDEGDVLLEIGKERYRLALRSAQANLESAGQEVGAGTAGVRSSEASLSEVRARLQQAQADFDRVERIHRADPGATSENQRNQVRSALAQAKSRVAEASADLEKSKEQLGRQGQDNPRLRTALAALETARLDLTRSTVRAPDAGVVTALAIDEGYYAQVGQPLMTLIAVDRPWIQADLRENQLAHVEPGDRVEIILDLHPGRIFKGKVASLSAGIDLGDQTPGRLLTVRSSRDWLRDAQRLPVIIHFDDSTDAAPARLGRRLGSQADVIVYTGDHPMLNALGRIWIRLLSFLSYAY
jgi:multidrug resistance efflux pump